VIGQWSEPQLATAAEGKSPRAAMNRVARQDMEILLERTKPRRFDRSTL